MRKPNHLAIAAVVTLLITALNTPVFAAVQASVSQEKVAMGDTFALRLQADGNSSQLTPNLTPLAADFEILGTRQSSRTSIVNGVASSTHGWIVTLAPKAEGNFTIPSITMGGDRTLPVTVRVVEAASLPAGNPPNTGVRVEMAAPPGPFYVQQEIPVTVRVISAAELHQVELSAPESPAAVVTKLGEDRLSRVTQGGQPATVIERTYRVKPQQSGELTLAPITLRGRMSNPDSRQSAVSDPFDRLGLAERFGGLGFGSSLLDEFMGPGQPVTARSAPLAIDIHARPGQAKGWFLPAKMVELSTSWTPETPSFRVGEAVTRSIQIVALGASEEQLPNITIGDVDGARIYVDRADARSVDTTDGTAAIKQISVSVVPTRSGTVTLPTVEVQWWDTTKDEQKTATLPAETIHVEGDEIAAAHGNGSVALLAAARPDEQATLPTGQTNQASWEMYMAVLVLPLTVLFAFFLANRRRKSAANDENCLAAVKQVSAKSAPSAERARLEQSLRKACLAGDAPLAYGSLQRWLAIGQSDVTRPLVIGSGEAGALAVALAELEQTLYAGQFAQCWNGKELLAAFGAFKSRKSTERSARNRADAIPPLYPIEANCSARLI